MWRVSETPCGLIAAFVRENDAEKLLQRGDLARVFGGPVQVRSLFTFDFTRRILHNITYRLPAINHYLSFKS